MNCGEKAFRSEARSKFKKRDTYQHGISEANLGCSYTLYSSSQQSRLKRTQSHFRIANTLSKFSFSSFIGWPSVATRKVTSMGNKATTGPFAPIVIITRDVVGTKRFNTVRGKAIALHSQVIKTFCDVVGAERKQAQGVIRLAKKNGERLGFLA